MCFSLESRILIQERLVDRISNMDYQIRQDPVLWRNTKCSCMDSIPLADLDFVVSDADDVLCCLSFGLSMSYIRIHDSYQVSFWLLHVHRM